ncbi:Cys-rich peptide radical SAM maturase CcpM [Clostridium botulinum]|uniref:Cys-rich peptide radical SAM maturase CcpM n=1 Tax=Clostridium botulinum TaxID=1491 RepID=UPI00248FBF87|nr:Cys-rich peptide radical SAM maturase CcpM [Clostridium botulinum]BDB02996.1 Cys-rich peptide radical SAM maturase CcpM [Clostridium botulinum]
MNKNPFIHLFCTSEGKYLYDVNTDKILKIPNCVYNYLKKKENTKENEEKAINYINYLQKNGFLKCKRIKETEHPSTKFLPFYYDYKLNFLTIQLTQNCNLRCEYCVYSGAYNTRTHSNKHMNFELAKKGIDYLVAHSSESSKLTFGFYGGEPLLEFELIEKCVKYIKEKTEGKETLFVITTNATLLKGEIVEFLVKNEFMITVSLDGPQYVHDISRKFANSNKGSFEVIISNLKQIKEQYPLFFKNNIYFNTVFTTQNGFNEISDFFSGEELFSESTFNTSIVSDIYAKEKISITRRFIEENRYEEFKVLLAKLGKLDEQDVSIIAKKEFNSTLRARIGKHASTRTEVPERWHHGGPCIPGVQRLFLNAEGKFFPCEKVSESTRFTCIGDVEQGLDIEAGRKILNIENFNKETCHSCWAYGYCELCVMQMGESLEEANVTLKSKCYQMRYAIEEHFKDYCTLKELGYDFEVGTVERMMINFGEKEYEFE